MELSFAITSCHRVAQELSWSCLGIFMELSSVITCYHGVGRQLSFVIRSCHGVDQELPGSCHGVVFCHQELLWSCLEVVLGH